MVSFILVAKEKKKRETYVKEYAKQHAIHKFDITVIEKDTSKKNTQSIGIEDIKKVQEKLFLKPIQSQIKLIIIEDSQLLTTEAQNALLKVLEEPPANTHIILATETKEVLLPTILSRCQLIELEQEQKTLPEKTIEEITSFIEKLPNLSIEERFKRAEELAKDKEKAMTWTENLIIILREQLLLTVNQTAKNDNPAATDLVYIIKKINSLHTILKTTNVNPRFAIEHTLLDI